MGTGPSMSKPEFKLTPEVAATIRWNVRVSCGNAGCTDPSCGCALCGDPIGVSEDDPRWNEHEEYCDGCELCEDLVPILLFRGEGAECEGAAFHTKCLQAMLAA